MCVVWCVCVCSGGWRWRPMVCVCGAGSVKIWPLAIVVTGCCKELSLYPPGLACGGVWGCRCLPGSASLQLQAALAGHHQAVLGEREKAVPRLQRLTCATTTSSPFPSPAVPQHPPPPPLPLPPEPSTPLNRPCRPRGRLPQAGAVAAATGRHPSLPALTCRASCAGDP